MRQFFIILFISLFSIHSFVFAQTIPDSDSLFAKAREKAFNNNYADAITDSKQILIHYPAHSDALNLMARIYAWEHQYDSSLAITRALLAKDSIMKEALLTTIDVFIWKGVNDSARFYLNKGLLAYPNDSDFISRLQKLNKKGSGTSPLNVIPSYDAIAGQHYFDFFNTPWVRRWHVSSLEYSRKREKYFFSLALNAGDLVLNNENLYSRGTNGQAEGILYYRLKKGYLFTSYAWSPGILFARHKGALEYFYPFEKQGIDVSLGIRYFRFPTASVPDLMVYTGSVGKEEGRSYIMLRYFFIPIKGNLYHSIFVKYIVYADNRLVNIYGVFGYGASPDERQRAGQFEIASQAGPYFRIGGQCRIVRKTYLYAEAGIRNENYMPGNRRFRTDAMAGIRVLIK